MPGKPAPLTFQEIKVALQLHQIERLRGTYTDLIGDPKWRDLAEFFFNDLYFVGDRSERNAAFLSVYHHFERVFDVSFLRGLRALIEFYRVSEKLDDDVTRALLAMGAGYGFTSGEYERAYRYADDYAERVEQLALVDETLTFVHRIAHRRMVGVLIRTMARAAGLLGARAMVGFLTRGYYAFRNANDIDLFKRTIATRERDRLDRIWRDVPYPAAGARRR
jgi:hypothetical protein